MKRKKYTAQEMRKAADGMLNNGIVSRYDDNSQRYGVRELRAQDISAMLRQAADTEELLEEKQFRLNEALRILEETREHRLILLNRLEAILKECENAKSRMSCDACRNHARRNNDVPECETDFMRCEKQEYDSIIKLARGEGVDK